MKNRTVEIKWGVIFILVSLAWMVMERALGWHDENIADHATYTNFFAIVAIAIYVFALRDKKNNFYQGQMTYKQGFISGVILTLVVTIFTPLSQYITSTIITPDYFTNVINYSVETQGYTQEEAEEYFNLQNYIIQSTIFALIVGIITSAVVAIFVKSKKES
ncbi:DUF4199 domain-containing protein [Algoriphagus sediminis]|uniref:DUF4199 domain-containing protein n=1 Tax=Algoriphagus sediminis TaxID=3057113 RepID=A0ABT7YFV0_9BACT|nr:DUF4199 domain-containing protein [Algoriphagus sediminis]MDN3205079.1 DUF4199 domain-containing protein [Algoriphagus sediminis]